jgi:sialate O-acetylesterase
MKIFRKISICKLLFVLVLSSTCIVFVTAQVKLPRLVRDSMILQRDANVKIWGWASNGEKIIVHFNNQIYKTKTSKDGRWSILLSPMKVGGPYSMVISGRNKILLREILIGDVWMCSGQSNMVHQMELHNIRYSAEIANANYLEIRHFFIPTMTDLQNKRDNFSTGYWKSANPENVRQFSAIAYFFAKKIYEKYHIPIGLINASVGGSPIEAWTSEEGLKDFSSVMNIIQKNKDTAIVNNAFRNGVANNSGRSLQKDEGMIGLKKWYDVSYIPKGWQNINIPGYWEDQGIKDLNGVVWYRKVIEVPSSMTGLNAKVFLGRIVDADALYINGILVGNTTYQYPQRRYQVPAGLLKSGKNIFVIRVTNTAGKGGFVPNKPYCLFTGKDTLDLKGEWQYKVGEVYIPRSGFSGGGMSAQSQPAALYNAMVSPIINYAIKGFLWYQGESNAGKAEEYSKLQPALIADWRDKWNLGNLPFLFVQLPNYMDANYLPSESQWAELRESQLKSLSISNTAMVVAIDLGEWNDIHPDNKKDVGERLALAAEKLSYGNNNEYAGPIYESSKMADNKITISFKHVGSGLTTNDGEGLSEFAIAGANKKFVWAKAIIVGDKIVVWNDDIPNPVYVRYAWADNPVHPNFYNKDGLPASPFRIGE